MTKIIVPSEIKVGGHIFRIVANRNLDANGKRAEIDFKRLVISLNTEKKYSIVQEGFIHEILHAVNQIFLNAQIESEDIIEPMAEGIWQVLEQLSIEFDFVNITDETPRD